MGFLNLFKLEKLKIYVYNTVERNQLAPKKFEVSFNPETYAQTFCNVFQNVQDLGSSGREARYAMSMPSDLKLKLIMDGTGVSETGLSNLIFGNKDVHTQVKEFLTHTFEMDGSIHQPKFLRIAWGKLSFDCRLKNVTVNYTMFDRSGAPLRAELDALFISDMATKKRLKKDKLSSPDLTHYRLVQAHDTLPALCEEIYGSPHYCIQIARVNKLNNYRKLIPGTELYFPPIMN